MMMIELEDVTRRLPGDGPERLGDLVCSQVFTLSYPILRSELSLSYSSLLLYPVWPSHSFVC